MTMHKLMAEAMDTAIEKIKAIQEHARKENDAERPVVANDYSSYSKGMDRS